MTCRLRLYGQNRNQMLGRITCHVIPEPRATLQGAATWWWIHCRDSRATCHITGCSYLAKSMSWSCHIAGCINSIRHIKNRFSPYFIFCFFFKFILGFDERRLSYRLWYTCIGIGKYLGVCPLGGVQGAQGQEPDLHRIICISVGYLKKLWTDFDDILYVEDYWKTRAWICMKCSMSTDVGTWTNLLTFEPDPDYSRDAGTGLLYPISFQCCYAEFYVGKIRRIRRSVGRCSEECF